MQKYILATSDFAKSIQTDINHYVTRDRIIDASYRQKLDAISKNIIRRQNPLELVFEDILTFDAENHIVGSLIWKIDLNEKQTDSDFIRSWPSQPGKKIWDKLKNFNKLWGIDPVKPPPFFGNNAPNFNFGRRAQTSSFNRTSSVGQGTQNNLFGSQTKTLTMEKVKEKNDTKLAIDDTLYELPEHTTLELNDGLIENLGVNAEDLCSVWQYY